MGYLLVEAFDGVTFEVVSGGGTVQVTIDAKGRVTVAPNPDLTTIITSR
jgi:DNA-binding protein YbaB